MKIDEKTLDIILKRIMDLKDTESFLVITDKPNEYLAKQIFEHGEKITEKARFIVIEELKENGQEPEKEIAEMMLQYNVQFYWTSKSLSHTNARRKASEKGHRIISSPFLTIDIINRCVDIDYEELVNLHRKIRPIISSSDMIRVTTKKGTDITFSVHDTHGKPDEILVNRAGLWNNLPVGEIDSGIIMQKTTGVLIFDGTFPELGILDTPIEVRVENGIGKIELNDKNAKKLHKRLSEVSQDAFRLAEFGIGTNPKAILTGNVLEDEKVLGTVHFAFGNDLSYDGTNNVPIHLDGVIKEPTIEVDGKIIMKDGKFL